jgi:hypothetical protein
MWLQVAKQTMAGGSELLDDATTELETAIGEVRGLARGIHPTILTETGLAAAIDALAERAPLPVTIDVADERYDPRIEATAYFVVAEALTNVARHASASEAQVTVSHEGERLAITVADDGRGGAELDGGSGLRGLADRLAAVGGDLFLSSPREGGTIVRAELPLRTAAALRARDSASAPVVDVGLDPLPGSELAAVRAYPQRPATGSIDRRVRTANPVLLTAAVTLLVSLLAIGAGIMNTGQKPPIVGRATTFAKPFYYQVPGDSGIKLFPGPLGDEGPSDHLHVLAVSNASPEGISIWIVEDGLETWCSSDGRLAPRPPGRDGLLAYLRSIPRLAVLTDPPITVDGRPAVRVDLMVRDSDSHCQGHGMALWRDGASPSTGQVIWIPDIARVRLIVFDVEDATIAIEIWSPENMPTWVPRAEAIVSSMQFIDRPSDEVPFGASPSKP